MEPTEFDLAAQADAIAFSKWQEACKAVHAVEKQLMEAEAERQRTFREYQARHAHFIRLREEGRHGSNEQAGAG